VWLLEELEVPYQTKLVDFRRMDGSGSRDPANPQANAENERETVSLVQKERPPGSAGEAVEV
jgi:hypothetical protein